VQCAAIFDMDGLLIDSEPLWQQAEREVFGSVGVRITPEQAEVTMGLRTDEVTAYWYARQPWTGRSLADVENAVIARVAQLIATQGEPKPGVDHALDFFARRRYRIGLASNSPELLIDAVLRRLAIGRHFAALCSSVHEARGKPDPAVYLTAAAKLGVSPSHCVVLEDSAPGVRAAKAAGMIVIAVPPAEHADDPAFAIADFKIASLLEVSAVHAVP
jgi:sugar-phosphatase